MDIFYMVAMKTRNGKTLFLMEGQTINSMKWTFDKQEAVWFELPIQAENFAREYFRNFNNWFIEEIEWKI